MATIESFDKLYQRAAERKGCSAYLEELLGLSPDRAVLAQIGDDRFLSAFTKKIFQSGFVWRVVEKKWPDFEQMFFDFNIEKVLMMPEEMVERKAQDPKIIRNYNKVKTIKANALMIFDIQQQGGSFAEFIANWPPNDIIGLWAYLKKHGQRLGGNTGPYSLRALGVDTFILSRDVEAYFRQHNVISGGINSKRSLDAIQQQFNNLSEQSGLCLSQLSRLIAFATGDNHVQAAD